MSTRAAGVRETSLGFSRTVILALGMLAALAITLWLMGRIPICKCGYVKLWHGVVKSSENSQHIADWYTPSHIIHGFIFYAVLHVLMPRASFGSKLLIALGVETAWEIAENSPLIINRYRANTIALDYFGDSIVNSISDCFSMLLGFFIARWAPVALVVLLAVGFELFTGYMIRDNLTLNVIMLLSPIEAIKVWQSGG